MENLKSYYIKKLSEIVIKEQDIDKINFGMYQDEDNYEVSFIVANKMGVENFAISLLESCGNQNLLNNWDDLKSIEKWDYGDVCITGIKYSDEKRLPEDFKSKELDQPLFKVSCLITLILIISIFVIGLITTIKWFL